jgi:ATP-dependent Lon protease
MLFVTAQKSSEIADPSHDELYKVGTVVRVLQLFRLPDGTMRVLVEGICRVRVERFFWSSDYYTVKVGVVGGTVGAGAEVEALMRNVLSLFNEYVHLNRRIPDEVLLTANNINDPSSLAHTVAAHLLVKVPQKQELLEVEGAAERLKQLSQTLAAELEIVKLAQDRGAGSLAGSQEPEGVLSQRAAQGDPQGARSPERVLERDRGADRGDQEGAHAARSRRQGGEGARSPVEDELHVARGDGRSQLPRLARVAAVEPHDARPRGHPRGRRILTRIITACAVKELTVEYLAAQAQRQEQGTDPGLSVRRVWQDVAGVDRARSAAGCSMALGGVRDEAEIRGHRRTDRPAGARDPESEEGRQRTVFLLDEVDKWARTRGDPPRRCSKADPEQNHTFNDHYLEVDFDLSQVMFICTANTLYNIPLALIDRRRSSAPRLPETEKVEIARSFLVPKQLAAAGLAPDDLKIGLPALRALVNRYTRESGVRNLEREIAGVCRKVAKRKAGGQLRGRVNVTAESLHRYLGPTRFLDSVVEDVARRRRERSRVDRGRRRGTDDRGRHPTRQGRAAAHRQAWRGHARVGSRGAVLRARSSEASRPRQVVLSRHRHSRAHSGRRESKDGPSAGITMWRSWR